MQRTLALALLSAALALPVPAYARDALLVTTNWGAGNEQVLLIDPEFGHIRSLWQGIGSELDAVLSPDGQRLYVTYVCRAAGCLSVVDAANGAILQTVEGLDVIRWIYATTPAMAVSPDGSRLFLLETNYSKGSHDFYVRTFDTGQGRLLDARERVSGCIGAQLMPFPNEQGFLLLCQRVGDRATPEFVLNFQHRVRGAIAGGKLYVAGRDGRVIEVDAATREVLRSSDEPLLKMFMPASGTLSPGGRLWYLPINSVNDGKPACEQIAVFDIQAMRAADTIVPKDPFRSLVLSSDGKELYAAAPEGDTIAVIDTATHETVRTLSVGGRPAVVQVAQVP